MGKVIDNFLAVAASIISSIFVGIITTKIYTNDKTWFEIILMLQWWNLIFVLWVVIMIIIFVRNRNKQNEFTIKSERLKTEQINALIKLTVESIMFPKRNGHINVHIFFKDTKRKKIILRKDRRFKYEQEDFPENYTLDYAIVDEDELIICESFKKEQTIYKELDLNHSQDYNERIKGKIGHNLKWVLSCPLHNPNGESFGVLCCFGSVVPFSSINKKDYFITLMQNMNNSIVRLLLFEKGREFKFIN